jgi:hypothetical protein
MIKYDTTQVFMYGDVVEELHVLTLDWWPELIPEGQCLKLKKNIYWTRQAARHHELLVPAISNRQPGWKSINTSLLTTRRLYS